MRHPEGAVDDLQSHAPLVAQACQAVSVVNHLSGKTRGQGAQAGAQGQQVISARQSVSVPMREWSEPGKAAGHRGTGAEASQAACRTPHIKWQQTCRPGA